MSKWELSETGEEGKGREGEGGGRRGREGSAPVMTNALWPDSFTRDNLTLASVIKVQVSQTIIQ